MFCASNTLFTHASVVGDNTQQRLGSRSVTQRGRPTKAKVASQLQFLLVPNPAKVSITLQSSVPILGATYLQICDYTGKVIVDDKVSLEQKRQTISLDAFLSGIYLLRVRYNNGQQFNSTFNVIK